MGENNFSSQPDKTTSTPINVNNMTKKAPSARKTKKVSLPLWFAVLICVVCVVLSSATILTSYLLAGITGERKAQQALSSYAPQVNVVNQNSTIVDNSGTTSVEEQRILAAEKAKKSVLTLHGYKEVVAGEWELTNKGSGVVWSVGTNEREEAISFIVTNYHVTKGCGKFTVITHDGISYDATYWASDRYSDLAVLKVNASLPAVEKSADAPKVGMNVLAVGSPARSMTEDVYANTVTDGIISSTARDLEVNGVTQTFLHFNATIYGGNSGGGLFDYYGRLCGIVTARDSVIPDFSFAIPLHQKISPIDKTATEVINELVEQKQVTGRPAMGIATHEHDGTRTLEEIEEGYASMGYPGLSTYMKKIGMYGLYVIEPFSTGLKKGDFIWAINNQLIYGQDTLNGFLATKKAGDTITVTVFRYDASRENQFYMDYVEITLGQMKG